MGLGTSGLGGISEIWGEKDGKSAGEKRLCFDVLRGEGAARCSPLPLPRGLGMLGVPCGSACALGAHGGV